MAGAVVVVVELLLGVLVVDVVVDLAVMVGATGGKPPLLPPPREVVWSQLSLRTWWRSPVRWPRWRCLQSGLGPLARHDEQDDQECADHAQAGTCPCPPAPATATVTFWVLLTSLKTVSTRTGRRPGSRSLLAATSTRHPRLRYHHCH